MKTLKKQIGRIKGVMHRLNVDVETANRVVDIANRLSPLDVKSEIYRPMLQFKSALSYDSAAENVALRGVKEEQRFESIMNNYRRN